MKANSNKHTRVGRARILSNVSQLVHLVAGTFTVLLGNPQRRTSLIKVPDVLALDIGREHALVQYLTIRPIWAQNIILMSSAMHAEMEGKINNAIRWG